MFTTENEAIEYVINENPTVFASRKTQIQLHPKLHSVPAEFRTVNLCKSAMDVNFMSYLHIPTHLVTYELTEIFLSNCKQFEFVPMHLVTRKYILDSMRKHGCSFCAPKELMIYAKKQLRLIHILLSI